MDKLDREQLIGLVERLMRGDSGGDEGVEGRWMDQIKASVPAPDIADYMFHDFSTPPLTPERIVDKALAYKPIALGGPSEP